MCEQVNVKGGVHFQQAGAKGGMVGAPAPFPLDTKSALLSSHVFFFFLVIKHIQVHPAGAQLHHSCYYIVYSSLKLCLYSLLASRTETIHFKQKCFVFPQLSQLLLFSKFWRCVSICHKVMDQEINLIHGQKGCSILEGSLISSCELAQLLSLLH